MAKEKKRKIQSTVPDINGMFIYHDDKNRIVYAPLFSRIGYIIQKSQIEEFYRYTQRNMISVFLGLAAIVLLGRSLFEGFFLGLIVYIGWTCFFSFRLLNHLAVIENFTRPKKDNYFVCLSRKYSRNTFYGIIGLALGFVLLMALYILTSPLSSTELLTQIILMTGVAVFALIHMAGLWIQLKSAD